MHLAIARARRHALITHHFVHVADKSLNSAPILTYCGNIHPGESWNDVLHNLEDHTLAVKRSFSPARSFPLGLRISAQAANELEPREIERFRDWCEAQGCHVLTVNGFPFGTFHGTSVKAAVYDPDWRDPRRVAYTIRLADILRQWVPSGRSTSISTVPIAFRPGFDASHWPIVRTHLLQAASHLARIHEAGGPLIRLALEPEPHCVLEQTAEVLEFFDRMQFPDALAEYVGLCFDCCHQAVEFEEPEHCVRRLYDAGVRIAKVQVSSALAARGAEIPALLKFDESTYLHQAVARTNDGRLTRFADLPLLAQWLRTGVQVEECRVHFHVPIFLPHLGEVGTTRAFLEQCLPLLPSDVPLEVETYSFGVLPAALRSSSLTESLLRELQWAADIWNASHRSH